MQTFTISIPKPCHEDWNNMTPDAKGAFCASCQKSVYDFTDKSDEEIISVFEKKGKEKVCGRFAPAQLSRPVVSFGNEISTGRLAKFVCALLLVFGSTLFSGVEGFAQNAKRDMKYAVLGKPSVCQVKPKTEMVKDSIVDINPIPDIITVADGQSTITGEGIFIEEMPLTGDTVIVESALADTLVIVEEPLDMVTVIEPSFMEADHMVMGISIVQIVEPDIEIAPIEEEPEVQAILANEPIVLLPAALEIKASPNPSQGDITLSYNLETRMPVKIDLFDVSGKLVRTLSQQAQQYPGKYNVSYNIADLPNGIYNAVLVTDGGKASVRVVLGK